MTTPIKFVLALALIATSFIAWKVFRIEAMLMHLQDCMYFGRPDQLMYRTKGESCAAYRRANKQPERGSL